MKKFISMALALVMTLSLCTFVTVPEADAFEDTGDLPQYSKQAIDVIQKIEVMTGYNEDGVETFKPEATLTRQAAAKIICNMILGPVTAKALPTNESPFPDVTPGTEWAGYISYCSHEGIIGGYSDGTFKPTGALTGYAFLKMLLGALGYSTQAEGFGGATVTNWKVNVAKVALGIQLNKGITSDPDGEHLDQGVTREDAAIYAFNTLQADLVEYPSQNSINVNGVTVSMGSGKATPQTWNTSVTSIDHISASRSDGNNARPIVQFAERYFDKLVREPNGYHRTTITTTTGQVQVFEDFGNGRDEYTTDDFGRPSVRWFWKGIEIGTYARAADATFVGNPKANEIYEALGMTSGDDGANLYINSNRPNKTNLDISRGNDKALDHVNNLNMVRNANLPNNGRSTDDGLDHRVDRLGNGSLVECFLNTANNHVDVCVISIYGGKVSSVRAASDKKDAYVTIDFASNDQSNHRPDTINVGDHNEFVTEEFDEDDVVAYTYSDSANSIKDMFLMNSEDGILQSRIAEKSMRLDDVTYTYGKEYTFSEMVENDLSSKSAYVVYMFQWAPVLGDREILGDDDDYALWIEEDEFAVDQYVLLERITIETTGRNAAGQKVTTKTASVMGTAEVSDSFDGDNDVVNQRAYNQSKAPVGTSTWDAQAQARFSNGTRRTVTLDDSKNYRTSAASDASNYADIQELETDVDGFAVKDGSRYYVTGNNNNGNGDGNWISAEFTAPRIVRLTSASSGYKLHRVDAKYTFSVSHFSLDSKKVYVTTDTNDDGIINSDDDRREISTPVITDSNGNRSGGTRLLIDSETHFVVEDTTNGTYKSYVGSKNVPDIHGTSARAFIYHRGDLAKLIFITNADSVSSSSNDIIFLSANSTSNLVDSDDGYYYDVNAVNKNVIETIRVKRGSTLHMGNLSFTPGADGNKSESRCVILNNVTYDSNDLLIDGFFDSSKVSATRAQGVRRINDEEIRLNTNGSSYLRDVSQGCKIYFVDGDDIQEIEYDEIINDSNDYVYYVEDDGVLTYLFVVNYEPEATVPTYNLNSTSRVNGYTIQFTGDTPDTVKSGDVLTFNVLLGNAIQRDTDVNVVLRYTVRNGDGEISTRTATEDENIPGLWNVTIPNAVENGTTVFIEVNEI